MRVLIYGINYAPELTGIGKYSGELGAWLARNNHSVDVITAYPYYPEWERHSAYKGKLWFSENLNGGTVYRTPLYVPREVTALKRILHEFSFTAGSIPYWLKALFGRRYDLVICVSPAFHLGFPALFYSRLKGVPFVYHIQDLQVDAARDLGMISSERLLKLLFKAEKFILDRCTMVSSISDGMLDKIRAKGIDEQKCILFPNWVDENHIRPLPKDASLREEFGLKVTDKVILYSGNLGEKQGLEQVIEVARLFQHRSDVVFLITGSGGAKKRLQRLAESHHLTNIQFFPLQPYAKLSALLATADLHLVLQKKSASDLVMPSKLTSILAAGGCPLVTASPGTSLYRVVREHQFGILVEPESTEALYDGISNALAADLDVYRTSARVYAEKYLSKEVILSDFEKKVEQMTAQITGKVMPSVSI